MDWKLLFEKIKNRTIQRIKETKVTRWIRFGFVSLFYFAWVLWMGNLGLLIFYLLLFDIYITGFIPFQWWKKSKSKAVRVIMSWVDAITYALILVYFVFAFIGQNYQIPTSSLEKTLLTGDYLWVNKMVYGPRVPMTPIHFPLVHNTIPFLNIKSYIEIPSLEYRRLKGFRNVETDDIVVFNFPAGDTTFTKAPDLDYYTFMKTPNGRDYIKYNSDQLGDIIYRPVDRRENYVKRCVGLPGQKFQIKNGVIYLDGKAQKQPKNVQFNYIIQSSSPFSESDWENFDIAVDDRKTLNLSEANVVNGLIESGFNVNKYIYCPPLTNEMLQKVKSCGKVEKVAKFNETSVARPEYIYPDVISERENWTSYNYGGSNGLIIPKKGMTITLTEDNWYRYHRCIRNYEHNYSAELRNGKVYINGKPTDKYTFLMDYYFMMGDNRDNSLDSRYWGFVPEDHIVGTPMFTLISFDKDKSIFNGGIRWDRIFRDANPDKD